MRELLRLFATIGFLSCMVGPGAHRVMAQAEPTLSNLFNELQSRQSTGQAAAQLLQLGSSDAGVRRYLAQHLPALIEADPRDTRSQWGNVMRLEWYNAVQLAAELKISEAAPALAKWISFSTAGGIIEAPLQDRPTGMALVQMGDPAVPALQQLLAHGNRDERWQSAYALDSIGSPKAEAVLREHAAHEPNKKLADFIRRATSK